MKRLALLLPFLILGCINQGAPSTGGGFGVVVTSFLSDFPDLESGDKVDLDLEVQNVGGTTADEVWALLYGIDTGVWSLSSTNPVKIATKFEGPEEAAGLPGSIDSAGWKLKAPNIPEGITAPSEARARIFYTYATTATATVPIITESEFKRLKGQNQALPQLTATQVSKGPVSVRIDAKSPEVLREDSDTFRVVIAINNVGGGSVFDPAAISNLKEGQEKSALLPEDTEDMFKIKVQAQGVTAEDCTALNAEQTEKLRTRTTSHYSCKLRISRKAPRVDIPITVALHYGYFIDATTPIPVTGVRE